MALHFSAVICSFEFLRRHLLLVFSLKGKVGIHMCENVNTLRVVVSRASFHHFCKSSEILNSKFGHNQRIRTMLDL